MLGVLATRKKKHIGLTKKNFDFQEAEFQLRRSNPLAFSAKQQLCPFCFIIVTCLTGGNSRPCSISKKIVDMQLHKSWSVLILLLLLTPTYFSLHFISSPHVQFLFFLVFHFNCTNGLFNSRDLTRRQKI